MKRGMNDVAGWAALVVAALGLLGALLYAQGGEVETTDPALGVWAKTYASNVLGFNAAYFAELDGAAISAAQKWALGKELIDLEAQAGARNLPQLWADASVNCRAALRKATKAILAQRKAEAQAAVVAVDQAIADADKTPAPAPTPTP